MRVGRRALSGAVGAPVRCCQGAAAFAWRTESREVASRQVEQPVLRESLHSSQVWKKKLTPGAMAEPEQAPVDDEETPVDEVACESIQAK